VFVLFLNQNRFPLQRQKLKKAETAEAEAAEAEAEAPNEGQEIANTM